MIPARVVRAVARRVRRIRARSWALVDEIDVGRRTQVSGGCVVDLDAGARLVLGTNCFLDRGVVLRAGAGATIEIGDDVFLGAGVLVNAADSVRIGSGTNLAEAASVHDADHVPGRPPNTGGLLVGAVTIGAEVWIAAKATVLRGVTVGDGAVIGAGSVVRGDVAPRALVVGVPAREVRRFPGVRRRPARAAAQPAGDLSRQLQTRSFDDPEEDLRAEQ